MALQDAGLETYDTNLALGDSGDDRDYTVAPQMLGDLGLDRVGVTFAERAPTAVHLNAINARYLATKAGRGTHAGPPVR